MVKPNVNVGEMHGQFISRRPHSGPISADFAGLAGMAGRISNVRIFVLLLIVLGLKSACINLSIRVFFVILRFRNCLMEDNRKSVYHTGSADGLIMGAAFIATMAVSLLSIKFESTALSLLFLAMAVPGIAALAAALIRKRMVENRCRDSFSSLWMHGITMFICGNLIFGLAFYVYLRFLDPEFLVRETLQAASLYSGLGTEEGDHMAKLLHSMVDKRLLPTPIAFAFSLMWFGSFFGSMLSLILTFLVRMSRPARLK